MASEAERSEASSQSEPRFAKARELLSMLVLEQGVSRKLSIFDTWCKNKKCLFSPKYHREVIKKGRPDPTRPVPNANWMLISREISLTKKNYQTKKLAPDHKMLDTKFGIDIYLSLAAMNGCAKYVFSSFSLITF